MKKFLLYFAFIVVTVITCFDFSACKKRLGEFVYFVPSRHIVHADMSCDHIKYPPIRVRLEDLFYEYKYDKETAEKIDIRYCNACVSDKIYQKILEYDVERPVVIDTAEVKNVYDLISSNYDIGEYPRFEHRMKERWVRLFFYHILKESELGTYKDIETFESHILKSKEM